MKAFLFSFTMPMLCPPDVSVKNGRKEGGAKREGGRASAVGSRRPQSENYVVPPLRCSDLAGLRHRAKGRQVCQDRGRYEGEKWKGEKWAKLGVRLVISCF